MAQTNFKAPLAMHQRHFYSSGTTWEPMVGYSRAVRVGQTIYVAGTMATDERGQLVGRGDPYRQAVQALHNIEQALRHVGGSLDDVVRTRIYVTSDEIWEIVGRAHGEVFGAIRPAATMLQVSRLVDPEMVVSIEAEAVVTRDTF